MSRQVSNTNRKRISGTVDLSYTLYRNTKIIDYIIPKVKGRRNVTDHYKSKIRPVTLSNLIHLDGVSYNLQQLYQNNRFLELIIWVPSSPTNTTLNQIQNNHIRILLGVISRFSPRQRLYTEKNPKST